MRDTLVDESESPFDMVVHEEVRARVEEELRQIRNPTAPRSSCAIWKTCRTKR